MRYLLDTNICIYLMKRSFPRLEEKLFSLSPDDVSVSSVTLFELEYGASKSLRPERTRESLYAFLAPMAVLPFDRAAALAAGRIRAELALNGCPIGPYDVQIAGAALSRSLTLVTHNVSEFSRVAGLIVEDWV